MSQPRPAPTTARLPLSGLLALAMAGFITILTEALPAGLLPQIGAGLAVSEPAKKVPAMRSIVGRKAEGYVADDRASGSTAPRTTWYRFTPDRTAAHPLAHLAGFRGFLQADAYAGYDGLYRGGVTKVACWAHFRRKVFDLHERVPTPLTTDILERIGTLYAVEAGVRGRPPDERHRARQE